MNIDFERGLKEKASLGELVEVCDVALSFIHERTQNTVGEVLSGKTIGSVFDCIINKLLERLA